MSSKPFHSFPRLMFGTVMGVLVFTAGCSDRNPNKSEPLLELESRLVTDKREYKLGETVIVREFLKNNTDKEIVICAWPTKSDVYFTHYGKEDSTTNESVLFYEPTTIDKSFLTLKPLSEIWYVTEEFEEDRFPKVGKWRYRKVSTYNFTGEHTGQTGWEGQLESKISIMIAPEEK